MAVTTTPITITHAAPHGTGGGLGSAITEVFSKSLGSNTFIYIALFIALFPLVIKIILTILKSREGVDLLVYNPETRKWRLRRAYQIVPGIYSTYDADVIAFVPVNAPSDRLVIGRRVYDVYPVVKYGGTYIYSELPKSLAIYYASEGLEIKPRSITELILELYKRKELKATTKIRPDMSLALFFDSKKLAEAIAEVYDRLAEESVVSIAQLTGKRKEYEAWVKTVIEMTLQKHAGIARILLILGIIFFLLMVASAFIH